MRKAKIVTIDGLGEVTVKEISPFAVYKAMSADKKGPELLALALDCISLPQEKVEKLYPSELEQLVDAFVEVNSSFLAIAGKVGLKQTITSMVAELSKTLPQVFADSYKLAMAMPGITAGTAS